MLIGIFVFPILYQNIHIVQHKKVQCCDAQHACEIKTQENLSDSYTLSIDEKGCPVCNYEMSVRPLVSFQSFSMVPTPVYYRVPIIPAETYCYLPYYAKGARAPPVL